MAVSYDSAVNQQGWKKAKKKSTKQKVHLQGKT